MYRRRKGTRDARAAQGVGMEANARGAYIGVYRIDHFIAVVQVSGPPARTLSLRKDAHAMGVSRFQLVHLPREHPNNSHILVLDGWGLNLLDLPHTNAYLQEGTVSK
jgi:hypothetical protein